MGPHRPELSNLVFTQDQGCQDIYRKTGQYGLKTSNEMSNLAIEVEYEGIKRN